MKILYLLSIFIIASCSFPKDSKDSLKNAKQEGLQVGIVNNLPFTYYKDGKASGIEVELIEEFATQEGLKIHYTYGSESTLIKNLEDYTLHLVIGGFEKNTPWKDKAGVGTVYNDKNIILLAKGENELLYRLETILLKHKKNEN